MPAIYTDSRWHSRNDTTATIRPTFSGFNAVEPEGLSNELRQAFAFLRRHGGGRYSAASLMKLLTAADQLDEVLSAGLTVETSTIPMVVTATVPFAYDEDTEVKSGGMVSAAVVLPDGRLMMAVNSNIRRAKLGLSTFRFVTNFLHPTPVVWIHQANQEGASFALALGLQPREVNSRGAVAWSSVALRHEDDNIATVNTEDYEYEDAMQSSRRNGRGRSTPRRDRPSRSRLEYSDSPPPIRDDYFAESDDEYEPESHCDTQTPDEILNRVRRSPTPLPSNW